MDEYLHNKPLYIAELTYTTFDMLYTRVLLVLLLDNKNSSLSVRLIDEQGCITRLNEKCHFL